MGITLLNDNIKNVTGNISEEEEIKNIVNSFVSRFKGRINFVSRSPGGEKQELSEKRVSLSPDPLTHLEDPGLSTVSRAGLIDSLEEVRQQSPGRDLPVTYEETILWEGQETAGDLWEGMNFNQSPGTETCQETLWSDQPASGYSPEVKDLPEVSCLESDRSDVLHDIQNSNSLVTEETPVSNSLVTELLSQREDLLQKIRDKKTDFETRVSLAEDLDKVHIRLEDILGRR